ncbi:hypothetical protein [Mycobacteroides sp. CBMA 326]|uniref:hypothetical protein n=1 Tax=Mycobacteroides sp. CBMA 326 TaxID=1904945 RepID=UPI0012DF3EA9|nr:hypothetical protein [Mycobacteroides sp. CBMA 326]MUM18214.1 hypothetical protein [Mycobacteroides sp. CBMA 326]
MCPDGVCRTNIGSRWGPAAVAASPSAKLSGWSRRSRAVSLNMLVSWPESAAGCAHALGLDVLSRPIVVAILTAVSNS